MTTAQEYQKTRAYYLNKRIEELKRQKAAARREEERLERLKQKEALSAERFSELMKTSDTEFRKIMNNVRVFDYLYALKHFGSWLYLRSVFESKALAERFNKECFHGGGPRELADKFEKPTPEKINEAIEYVNSIREPCLRKLVFLPIHLEQAGRFSTLAEKIFSRTCTKKEYCAFLHENPFTIIALDSQSLTRVYSKEEQKKCAKVIEEMLAERTEYLRKYLAKCDIYECPRKETPKGTPFDRSMERRAKELREMRGYFREIFSSDKYALDTGHSLTQGL